MWDITSVSAALQTTGEQAFVGHEGRLILAGTTLLIDTIAGDKVDLNTTREFNDLPRDGTKTASIRLMKIAEDVRKHAGEQGIAEEEARKTGMEEKSREFVENGAEVYAKV